MPWRTSILCTFLVVPQGLPPPSQTILAPCLLDMYTMVGPCCIRPSFILGYYKHRYLRVLTVGYLRPSNTDPLPQREGTQEYMKQQGSRDQVNCAKVIMLREFAGQGVMPPHHTCQLLTWSICSLVSYTFNKVRGLACLQPQQAVYCNRKVYADLLRAMQQACLQTKPHQGLSSST